MRFRRRSQGDFEAEVRSHLELEAERLRSQGMSAEAARDAARRAFGNVTQTTERFYESRRVRWLDALSRDVRYALRTLRKSPGFTLTAVLTLAFGLGMNTAIFTLIYGLALRPLPVGHPHRVVTLFQAMRGNVSRSVYGTPTMISYPEYRDYRDGARSLAGLAAYGEIDVSATGAEATAVHGQLASCNYFQVLEVPLALGRPFVAEECSQPGASPVVVVSQGFWRRQLGSDPAVLGKALTLNGRTYSIVGVAEAGFGGTELQAADFWAPVTMQGQLWELDWLAKRDASWLTAIGRLQAGAGVEQARAELELVARRADAEHPGRTTTVQVNVGTLTNNPEMRRLGRMIAVAALTLVALVVLMACANVMNLLLARAAARRREIGIRLALGAGRGRLVAQLMTESALLAFLGGGAGLLLARWLPPVLLRALPNQELTVNLMPDLRIFGYAFLLTVIAALGFGLLPAWHASRLELVAVLKGEGSSRRTRAPRLRHSVVALEVAGCLLLLIVGGLLTRGVVHARFINPGYQTDKLLVVGIELRQAGYDAPRAAAFMRELSERLAALPGVESVAAVGMLPLLGRRTTGILSEGTDVTVLWNVVSGSYFKTMGIPLLRGRSFRPDEPRAGTAIPAVVTPAFARRFFGTREPLGQQFMSSTDSIRYEVVGVAADVRSASLAELDGPYFYEAANPARAEGRLLLRTTGDPGALRAEAAGIARSLDRKVVALVEPFEERLALWRRPAEVGALLASLLGLLAALVAVVGVYGVVSYAVSQRTREIGVRVALGAQRGDILRLVLRQGFAPVAIGTAIGLALAAGAGQVIRGALYGVSGLDPLAFLGMLGLLALAAGLAMLLPARRAVSVDPAVTLRAE